MANVSITKRSVFNSTTAIQYGTVCKQLIDLLVQDTNLILKGVITNTTSTYSVEYYVSSDTNSWIRFYNSTYNVYFQVYYKNSATEPFPNGRAFVEAFKMLFFNSLLKVNRLRLLSCLINDYFRFQ